MNSNHETTLLQISAVNDKLSSMGEQMTTLALQIQTTNDNLTVKFGALMDIMKTQLPIRPQPLPTSANPGGKDSTPILSSPYTTIPPLSVSPFIQFGSNASSTISLEPSTGIRVGDFFVGDNEFNNPTMPISAPRMHHTYQIYTNTTQNIMTPFTLGYTPTSHEYRPQYTTPFTAMGTTNGSSQNSHPRYQPPPITVVPFTATHQNLFTTPYSESYTTRPSHIQPHYKFPKMDFPKFDGKEARS